MEQQLGFSDLYFRKSKHVTLKEKFLSKMEVIVPWIALEDLIAPYYPKAGNGRRPYPLSSMLRIHCFQQSYRLSDAAMEDSLYETASMGCFSKLSLDKSLPDHTTIIKAPSSTKNKLNQRDPEMHQTKKGNQWHFGMKTHIGVDVNSGHTHTFKTTAANEHNFNQAHHLLHGEEEYILLILDIVTHKSERNYRTLK